jgi:hypothetical protein
MWSAGRWTNMTIDPRQLQGLFGSGTLVRIQDKQIGDKSLPLFGNALPFSACAAPFAVY